MTPEEYNAQVNEAETTWAREIADAVLEGVSAATIAHLIAASYVDGRRTALEEARAWIRAFTWLGYWAQQANRIRRHYKTEDLYGADPNCKHEVLAKWSGVECRLCRGWYCA